MTSKSPTSNLLENEANSPSTILVIFGASGDLTARKLAPAIFNLSLDGLLPSECFLIGYGRQRMSDDEFKAYLKDSLDAHSRRRIEGKAWEQLERKISFQAGSYDDPKSFEELKLKIEGIEKQLGQPMQCLFYVSTPPGVFKPILENLGKRGLAKRHSQKQFESKVIIEKPFGRDLESARELNEVINLRFEETQVFRIDHYLGKETVQSLLVQRFANSIFEPIWNRNYVSCVQITVSEDLGVGSRGGYYDRSGALRDMMQNHVMQLLALTAMEPPSSLDPEAIRDEKVKVIEALETETLDDEGEKVDAIIERFSGDAGQSDLGVVQPLIDAAFEGDDVSVILNRLEAADDAWSKAVLKILSSKSPTAVKVTLKALRKGAELSLRDVMVQDLRVSSRFLREGSDFYEGVRAVIIDKDNAPNWSAPVSDAEVDAYFEPLAADKEMAFLD